MGLEVGIWLDRKESWREVMLGEGLGTPRQVGWYIGAIISSSGKLKSLRIFI